jgi:PHD/YefM family antitoxin component YafN of YafNO toxin-antitoxin module
MSDGKERAHPSVDMTKVGKVMRKLHDQVCGSKQRVEITRPGSDDVCVMISKKELESLEQAMAVLTDTDAFLATCDQIKKLIAAAGMVHGPTPEPEPVGA